MNGPSLLPSYDLLILGRGIAGLSLAFRAAQAGLKVLLLGKDKNIASHAALGLSTLKGLALPASPLFSAKLEGHRGMPQWFIDIEKVARRKVNWSNRSVVEPFWDSASFEKIRKRVYRQGFRGPSGTKIVKASEAEGLGLNVHKLGSSLFAYFVYEDGIYFEPRSVLVSLELALENLGVAVVDQEVARTQIQANSVQVFFSTKEPPVQVNTTAIIYACGYSIGSLLRPLGISVPNLYRVGGETASFPSKTCHFLACVSELSGFTLKDGLLRMGSSSHVIQSNELDDEYRSEVRKKTQAVVNKYVDNLGLKCDFPGENQDVFSYGERIRLKDRAPLVDIFRSSNDLSREKVGVRIGVVGGFYKSGFQLADPVAKHLLWKLFGVLSKHPSRLLTDATWKSFSMNEKR